MIDRRVIDKEFEADDAAEYMPGTPNTSTDGSKAQDPISKVDIAGAGVSSKTWGANPKARTSADHQSEQGAKYEETHRSRYEETRRCNVYYRIQGIPHSVVQKEDANRKEIVQKD